MTTTNTGISQTRSFATVFLIEMWERFGFYGMQVLMVTYMMKKLGFVDTRANLVWGAATALIYATPAIGGWIGDKLLGTRRTMLMGAVVLAIGYALLWLPTDDEHFLYIALGVIIVGNGMFKPNAGNLVRKIYEGDDTRIDSAFTIYYMAVNIGSMISMTLTPWIRDYVGARYGKVRPLADDGDVAFEPLQHGGTTHPGEHPFERADGERQQSRIADADGSGIFR